MSATDVLQKVIDGVSVEVMTYSKGDGALVFVDDEYAGSAERDSELQTWTAFPLFADNGVNSSEGMWSAVRRIVRVHLLASMVEAMAR